MVHLHSFLSQNSLLDYLQELELVGDDVVAIATHCHFDHSGGLHNFSEVIYRDLSCMFLDTLCVQVLPQLRRCGSTRRNQRV